MPYLANFRDCLIHAPVNRLEVGRSDLERGVEGGSVRWRHLLCKGVGASRKAARVPRVGLGGGTRRAHRVYRCRGGRGSLAGSVLYSQRHYQQQHCGRFACCAARDRRHGCGCGGLVGHGNIGTLSRRKRTGPDDSDDGETNGTRREPRKPQRLLEQKHARWGGG